MNLVEANLRGVTYTLQGCNIFYAHPLQHLYIISRVGVMVSFQKGVVILPIVFVMPVLPAFVILYRSFPIIKAHVFFGNAESKQVVPLHQVRRLQVSGFEQALLHNYLGVFYATGYYIGIHTILMLCLGGQRTKQGAEQNNKL